jgi:hypothetical protein
VSQWSCLPASSIHSPFVYLNLIKSYHSVFQRPTILDEDQSSYQVNPVDLT